MREHQAIDLRSPCCSCRREALAWMDLRGKATAASNGVDLMAHVYNGISGGLSHHQNQTTLRHHRTHQSAIG